MGAIPEVPTVYEVLEEMAITVSCCAAPAPAAKLLIHTAALAPGLPASQGSLSTLLCDLPLQQFSSVVW